ncbi:MAG: glycosyltransferase 87 family protein [Acidimicrobiia bacterium]
MGHRGRGRGPLWALAVVAAAGAALRVAPILAYGRYGSRPDYDDGVNFAAATLLTGGTLPYRDFFYAHPPGGLLALAPFGLLGRWMDPGRAFTVAGLAVVAVAALTTFLLGRLCWRTWGPAAGLVAAAAYAVHPEVVVAERTTFMEPVLNLACIGLATLWLDQPTPSRRRALAAGALAGAAVTLKLWGVPWVVAALVAVPRDSDDRRAALARFSAAAAGVVALVTLPFALPALGGFVDGVLRFHLWRPPDGTLSVSGRVHELLGFVPDNWRVRDGRHAGTALLAVGGAAVAAWRARRAAARPERFFLAAFVLVAAVFLSGRSYYTHYNAHLGLAESALAGTFAGALWDVAGRLPVVRRAAQAVLAALLLVAPWLSLREAREDARMRSPELVDLGSAVRALPADACVLPFEPTWGFAGGRLPSTPDRGPVVIDPYGVMIFDAVEGGSRFDGLGALFADDRSQRRITEAMAGCRFVVVGGRGEFQLSEGTKAWLRQHFVRLEGAGDIWERVGSPPPPT